MKKFLIFILLLIGLIGISCETPTESNPPAKKNPGVLYIRNAVVSYFDASEQLDIYTYIDGTFKGNTYYGQTRKITMADDQWHSFSIESAEYETTAFYVSGNVRVQYNGELHVVVKNTGVYEE